MTSDEIRAQYLKYFESKGHTIIPSSSLVPQDDPTLLFTTAGMVQIKPYFMGEAVPPNNRLTSSQKCFRTTDIDRVGNTKHLTFFEMLGNFSVGDYFKKEAIEFAWEFVTKKLQLSAERLWTTVFTEDDEAFQYWIEMGVPTERIVRYGEDQGNFWGPAGETGPCGPCSEIHFDFGVEKGCGKPDCGPACDCGRFLEIWNLVFMQYFQDLDRNRIPLPKQNIDTGMGLERITTLMAGKSSVYETDIFEPVLDKVAKISGLRYGESEQKDRAARVIAEHGRSVTFLIADGVIPSNEGRGYVLRRVLRRAIRFGRVLGLDKPFLGDIAESVIAKMGRAYPEIVAMRDFILKVLKAEEAKFNQTLTQGLNLLDKIIEDTRARRHSVIAGEDVFRLHDTYGFPVELTAEVAEEQELEIDLTGFEAAMTRQREQARATAKFGLAKRVDASIFEALNLPATEFVGYQKLQERSHILAIVIGEESVETAVEGQEVEIVLDRTPFYAESGGQVGDRGTITSKSANITVFDTLRPIPDIVSHRAKVEHGYLFVGDAVTASVDAERRHDIMRNHTATHLLHAAIRRVLGPHAQQAGSLVAPDRFRFDFSHLGSTTQEELKQIEDIANAKILEDLPVRVKLTSYSDAVAEGAMALFGEKYGEQVRLVMVGRGNGKKERFSAELCGGTHVNSTGEIGLLHILSESSVGSGMRRIEAVTGRGAEQVFHEYRERISAISNMLQAPTSEVEERITAILSELASERKKTAVLQREILKKDVESLLGKVQQVNGVKLLSAKVEAPNMEVMREMGDWLKARLGSGVVVLGSVINDRPSFLAMVTSDLVAKGVNAGNIVKQVATVAGGGGGGRPELAQAGGKDVQKLDEALEAARKLL